MSTNVQMMMSRMAKTKNTNRNTRFPVTEIQTQQNDINRTHTTVP